VLSFNNYEKPATNTFALSKLPSVHEWGTSRLFEDKSGLLCTPGKNEPFVLWIVGRVSRTWFFDKQSKPVPQVSINIVPSTTMLDKLQGRHCVTFRSWLFVCL